MKSQINEVHFGDSNTSRFFNIVQNMNLKYGFTSSARKDGHILKLFPWKNIGVMHVALDISINVVSGETDIKISINSSEGHKEIHKKLDLTSEVDINRLNKYFSVLNGINKNKGNSIYNYISQNENVYNLGESKMKKSAIQKLVEQLIEQEIQSFLSIGPETNGTKEIKAPEVPWEKVVPSGTEEVAIITEPEKIGKIMSIAKIAQQKSPMMGMCDVCENKEVQLYKPSKGTHAKFKMHIKDGKGQIKEIHFGKKHKTNEARSIGKRNIDKLKMIVKQEYNKNHNVDAETIEKLVPSEWYDTWESAWSEIQRIIDDELLSLVHGRH